MMRVPEFAHAMAILIAALAPPFCISTAHASSAVPARAQAISIKMFAFTPQVLTVAAGTTVVWTNADDDPHTVTANDNSFHSAALDTAKTFAFTFTRPGEFAYFCSLHPHMTGKIVVRAN
jgi:plastocyanin